MVSMVTEVPGTGNLRVRYAIPDGHSVEEEFDLVVLSVGLEPPDGAQALASRLGIDLNEYGFAEPPPFQPGQTTRPGVFVAGSFSEPKDIPETVIEASCAAAQASALLAEGRGSQVKEVIYPPERDVTEEHARIGVFICHCGINIGGVVQVPEVVEYAASLPGVVYAEANLYTCSQDTQQRIQERIGEHRLNRVVVASCTPRTHEPLFQETLRGAGLNPHLFEMANIREQDSWVHRDDSQAATEKAKDLVAMAVAKAQNLRPIPHRTFEVVSHALVIGGGLAGMTAALTIAEQGFGVTLVERQAHLGGNLRHIHTPLPATPNHRRGAVPAPSLPATPDHRRGAVPAPSDAPTPTSDPQTLLHRTIDAVSANPRIAVLTDAEIVNVGGYLGQYHTAVQRADGWQEEIQHGVIVVATGAQQIEPQEYLYGEHPQVVTQRELEDMLAENKGQEAGGKGQEAGGSLRSVVMIQCVGSRDDEHPYCSRICCGKAVKNALHVKELNPEARVYVLCRDVRVYGLNERHYREAREKGVIFLKYEEDAKPQVSADNGRLVVRTKDHVLNRELAIDADLVVLSAGIGPNEDNRALSQLLKVPLDADGFFLEAHVKLRPVDFATDGVFVCGLAHYPKDISESIAQARAAASRAATVLSKSEIEVEGKVAHADPARCSGCGECVDVCAYKAIELDPLLRIAVVNEATCKGCGACTATCRAGAMDLKGFRNDQILQAVDAM